MKFSDAVRAMALAHDQLSWTQAGQVVQLSSYLSALASNVEVAFENVTFEVKSDELEVPIEQAVAIGLIVNELVTNSLKHAFNGAGRIEIHLRAGSGPGLALLEVKDNGKGMDKTKVGGSGIQLVRGLTEQIRGRFEQDSSRTGTTSRIIFPVRVV
jgi:two-component sensor histidine kinase